MKELPTPEIWHMDPTSYQAGGIYSELYVPDECVYDTRLSWYSRSASHALVAIFALIDLGTAKVNSEIDELELEVRNATELQV